MLTIYSEVYAICFLYFNKHLIQRIEIARTSCMSTTPAHSLARYRRQQRQYRVSKMSIAKRKQGEEKRLYTTNAYLSNELYKRPDLLLRCETVYQKQYVFN